MSSDNFATVVHAVALARSAVVGFHDVQGTVVDHVLADSLAGLAATKPTHGVPNRAIQKGVVLGTTDRRERAEHPISAEQHAGGDVDDVDGGVVHDGILASGWSVSSLITWTFSCSGEPRWSRICAPIHYERP